MPISYKHKIYTTLGTPTTLSGNVVSATDSAGVPAKDYTVKGKTIVWNQLLDKSKYPATTTTNGVTFTNNGDGSIAVNGTATDDSGFLLLSPYADSLIPGHKYLISGSPNDASINAYIQCYDSINRQWLSDRGGGDIAIFPKVVGPNVVSFIRIRIAGGYTANNLVFKPQLFDLTQMFGAGNEPTTVAQFCAMFPDDYYPYNAGELKSIMPTSVEASTINLLNLVGRKEISSDTVGYRAPTDAYPEIDTHVYYRGISPNGYLRSWAVVEATVLSSSVIAKTGTVSVSANYGVGIPLTVVPSTTYYIKCTTSGVVSVGYANSNKVITSFDTPSNNQFTTPGDCRYALIVFRPNALDTQATFENICISAVQTNEYQPYNKYRANIPSSKYFPDGMKSAGSVYDEINFLSQKAIKRIGSVDLGTLNWTYRGSGDNRYFETIGISDIKKISNSLEMPGLLNAIYPVFPQSNWYLNKPCMFKIQGNTPEFCIADPAYTDAAAFKAAMSGVMLYYELDTPVETAITPPLQALQTFKGFTSFSAPNSLMQNGPLSVTYYAEGGANPESGWLTSYRRKLYMGRTIEWNQIIDVSNFTTKTIGGVVASKKANGTIHIFGWASSNTGGRTSWGITASLTANHKYYAYQSYANLVGPFLSLSGQTSKYFIGEFITCDTSGTYFFGYNVQANTQYDTDIRVMLFDLTQMFGAGNEPATPAEFWSYFDHKVYPYNAGETQPLFKISRKSQWGSATATALYVGENIVIPQTVRN